MHAHTHMCTNVENGRSVVYLTMLQQCLFPSLILYSSCVICHPWGQLKEGYMKGYMGFCTMFATLCESIIISRLKKTLNTSKLVHEYHRHILSFFFSKWEISHI